jgi:soluble lytic murein transglycosylase
MPGYGWILAWLLLSAGISRAQPFANPLPAVRADNWAAAEAAVQTYADPVARLVVTYLRLVAPGSARSDEIAAFMADHPDWPNQALLEHRREEALASAPAGAGLLAQCQAAALSLPAALLRCADAWQLAGDPVAAAAAARRAWVGTGITDPTAEAAFLQRWAGLLTPDDQFARFRALAWAGSPAAGRQLGRLAAARRLAAEARLALQHNAPTAPVLLAALPAGSQDPDLFLDRARALRRAGQFSAAAALWSAHGEAAEDAAPVHGGAFWAERNALARALLRAGDADGAYALAAGHGPLAGEAAIDAEFLAGFIALRRLANPRLAAMHFSHLAALTDAAITQGRAWYWLGRAAAAAGADARPAYRAAAAFPCTFYGQLAAAALGEDPATRLRALHDPAWSGPQAWALETRDLARAAALLVAWGEPRRARAFLLQLEATVPDLPSRAAAAHLALAVGEPAVAVAIARRIGRDGGMLPDAGWPAAAGAPSGPVDPAVTLGLIRQESSFDPGALSPAGARGLMQLMPATAQATARHLGEYVSPGTLTTDPAANIRLGTTYLHELLEQFGGALPLAIAAYNAGPNRVQEWLAGNGDPRGAPAATAAPDIIDWIELIPFSETRNYVQRVLENAVVYRARLGEAGPPLLAGQGS